MNYTDRTRCEEWTECHRKRWWANEWGKGLAIPDPEEAQFEHPREPLAHIGGLEPAQYGLELEVGSAVHEGAAELWHGAAVGLEEEEGQVRDAVAWAIGAFRTSVAQGIRLPDGLTPEAREFKLREAEALVEGFVWVLGLRVIPALLERFEVLEVEKEGMAQLTPEIQFLYRPDALLQERESGDLYVWSLKVVKEPWEQGYKRDVQGMSECWARSQDLAEPRATMGVIMTYLLKGREYAQQMPDGSEAKVHSCPLTKAWRADDGLSQEWAWSYEVPRISKNGEQYMGRLGKGWVQTPAWEFPGGVEAWVRALLGGEVQAEAGDPLSKLVLVPESYWRNDLEVADWVEEVQQSEGDLIEHSRQANVLLKLKDWPELRHHLNRRFPRNRKACMKYGTGHPCRFLGLCEGGQGWMDPLGAGFKLRSANHPKEEGE